MVLGLRGNQSVIFLIFGLAAGVASLSLSIFLKLTFNGLFIPEIAAQGLVSITSGEIESQAVLTLGPLAKYSTIVGAIVVNVILYGLIGIVLGKLFMKMKSPRFAIKFTLSTFISYSILIAIALISITLGTIPGQSISIPVQSIVLFLLPSIAYGLIFVFLFGKKHEKTDPVEPSQKIDEGQIINKSSKIGDIDHNKRDMIRALIISVIAIPLVYFGFNRLITGSRSE